ncbi:hypothetical protein HYY74_01200 [Candidatus Woesearchaeota archaeon]|nr:hypothetical protein [Candidatus Woesearchaeota archaeon]
MDLRKLRTRVGEAVNTLWAVLLRQKILIFAFLGVVIAAYTLGFSSIADAVLIIVLFLVAAFSTFYKRYFRAPPAFELMTFSVVLMTVKFGLVAGFVFGAIVQVASEAAHGAIDAQIVIFVPARAALSIWTWVAMSLFNVTDFFTLGMIAVVGYNLMVQPISWFMGDMQLRAKTVYYTLFYTVCNFFVFSILSGPVQYLL